jgi:hypothetical protein
MAAERVWEADQPCARPHNFAIPADCEFIRSLQMARFSVEDRWQDILLSLSGHSLHRKWQHAWRNWIGLSLCYCSAQSV